MVTLFDIAIIKNLQKFTLLWLDSSVHKTRENLNAQFLFRIAFNPVKIFNEKDPCLDYIQSNSDERLVLIVSGRLGEEIIPQIHCYPQLVSIYIYCSDKKRSETWSRSYLKVKRVMIAFKPLIVQIQTDQVKRMDYPIDQSLPISTFYLDSPLDESVRAKNEHFLHNQLFLECLSRMKCLSNVKEELIQLCRNEYEDDPETMNFIDEFEDNYTPNHAIWWFTRDSFLHRFFAKVLQCEDISRLFTFHFLLHDIREKLEEESCPSSLEFYRAQWMSDDEIQQFRSSIGQWISINTFFSTSANRRRALSMFFSSKPTKPMRRVLFEIHHHDPYRAAVKPFGDISASHYYTGTEVNLFMIGSVFHLIDMFEEGQMLIVELETVFDLDEPLKMFHLDSLYFEETNLLKFSEILSKMKLYDLAEFYYQRLLNEVPNDHQSIARCYQGLAQLALVKEDYNQCLEYYKRSLKIHQDILRSYDPEIGSDFSTIAEIYTKKGLCNEALDFYSEALKIYTCALGKDHPKLIRCHQSMADIYEKQENYAEALDCCEKALAIREKHVARHELDSAQLHSIIARLYIRLDQRDKALVHYRLSLRFYQQIYPIDHDDVMMAMKNLALLHESLDHHQKALRYWSQIPPDVRRKFSSQ